MKETETIVHHARAGVGAGLRPAPTTIEIDFLLDRELKSALRQTFLQISSINQVVILCFAEICQEIYLFF